MGLNYLSSYNINDQEEKEEESTFVRGCAMQSTPRTQKRTKLSDKASASGFKLKMDHEIDATEKLSKRTMGVLNRITPEKFDKLSQRMLEIIEELADNEERFTIILDLILNKASTDIEFAEQYAQLCNYLSHQFKNNTLEWLRDSKQDQLDKLFKKMMVVSCQRRFASQREAIAEPLPFGLDAESKSDLETKRKKKFFGTMIIIGELYNKKLISSQIVYKGIIKSLLPPKNKQVSVVEIEALCKLLKTCGRFMDKDEKAHKVLLRFIGLMKKCAAKYGFRIQVLVDEIDEMSKNKWKQRLKKEKAKKLDELHDDFAKLQMKHQRITSNNNRQRQQQHQPKQQRYKKKENNNNNNQKKKKRESPKKSKSKFGKSNSSFGNRIIQANDQSYYG